MGRVKEARETLAQRANQCPGERFVLAGYSQGAMLMHRVLTDATDGDVLPLDSEVLDRIDASILIADGDRFPHDNTTNFGNAKDYAIGIATLGDHSRTPARLPNDLHARTFSVCISGDIVCDFRVAAGITSGVDYGYGIGVHLSYKYLPVLGDVGDTVAALMNVLLSGNTTTIAGNGETGSSGDGGPATQASVEWPAGVAFDGLGNMYIADNVANRVRKVAAETGVITTVAGNGTWGFCGDNGPATAACLASPTDVAVDVSGNLYIADPGNDRVRKVAPDGTITTFAGTDNQACGTGGPATNVCLWNAFSIAVDNEGNVYIANVAIVYAVYKVTPAGMLTRFAGNGTTTFCGDGGPATAACLTPTSLAVDADGSVYIADYYDRRVRKVTPDGIIHTVAGTGTTGYCGDGGPATSACIEAGDIAVDAAGNLFIADYTLNRVRRVATNGTITHFAGNGTFLFCGDHKPATQSCISPSNLAVTGEGNVIISDVFNRRVLRILQ